MRKKVFAVVVICSLLFTLHHRQNHIKIASFNIRFFSIENRDTEDFEYIAKILSKFDVIAIQELEDVEALERTMQFMRGYSYKVSDKVGRERYAFVYNKRVRPLEEGRIYGSGGKFIRDPYYATFRAGNFDFTLITVHILYGESEEARRPEVRELAKVYEYIQGKDPSENDIILLGDFNLPPTDEAFMDLKSIPSMIHLVKSPEKTTISDKSLLDNIWFQRKYVREYSGRYGVYEFDRNFRSKRQARRISDHRPVWAEFKINRDDD